MEQGRQDLYLFTSDRENSVVLYRVREPRVNGHKPSARVLGKPLLEMDNSMYPDSMSFTKIGSRIFMVGGSLNRRNSNKVFIYDTSSSNLDLDRGPDLNSGMFSPLLFTFGSKIFAFSRVISWKDDYGDDYEDDVPKHRFEMWDTDMGTLDVKWSPLPAPLLQVSGERRCYGVCGSAAVYVDGRPVIFISVLNVGTYAFEVDEKVWHYLGAETLPISEDAVTIPHAPSMCCGYSSSSGSFAVFRFFYEGNGNGNGFGFEEIPVNGCEKLPLGPPLESESPLPVVFGLDNRVYFISTGDDDDAYCYVKVYAVRFEGVSWKRPLIKEEVGHGLGLELKMFPYKRRHQNDEVALTKGQSSKMSGKKKKEKSRNGNDEEEDETTKVNLKKREMEVEEDTTQVFDYVNLSSMWGKCYRRRAANQIANVWGAIAM